MDTDLEQIKDALLRTFPELGKVSFRKRDSKYYLTIKTDVLDPSKTCRDIEVFLNKEGEKYNWRAGLTSSSVSNDLRDATFRLNYERKF